MSGFTSGRAAPAPQQQTTQAPAEASAAGLAVGGSAAAAGGGLLELQASPGGGNSAVQDAIRRGAGQAAKGAETLSETADLGQLTKGGAALVSLAAKLTEAAQKSTAEAAAKRFMGMDGADSLLAQAASLTDLAAKITEAGNGIKGLTASGKSLLAEDAATHLGTLKKCLAAVDVVAALRSDAKTKAFLAAPTDAEKARAWAMEAARIFKKGADLVPGGTEQNPLPFIARMLKGYLSAPERYVQVVLTIFKDYADRIDKRGKVDGHKVKMGDGSWHGPLTMLYAGFGQPAGFQGAMKLAALRNKKLKDLPKGEACAALIRDFQKHAPADSKDAYITHVTDWLRKGNKTSKVSETDDDSGGTAE